jgi:putative ABC transport system permease protein
MIHDFVQDLRSGIRLLRKSPVFTLVAVATLALAIGANTAVFGVLHSVLLTPLPYPDADRLYMIWETNLPQSRPQDQPSPANFLDWRQMNRSFSKMAAFGTAFSTIEVDGRVESLNSAYYTEDFFELAGVAPALGRFPSPEEIDARTPLAVVSYDYWQRRLGGKADAAGKTVIVERRLYRIAAVLPPGFALPAENTDLWYPFSFRKDPPRAQHYLHVIARLKPGVKAGQAKADLDAVAQRLSEMYSTSNRGWGVSLVPLREYVIGDARLAILVMAGAAGFLLLIACANLGNLQLARASARTREMAVRAALGASTARLLRQLLAESLLLAGTGAAAGLVVALGGWRVLTQWLPTSIPRMHEVKIDLPVLAFTLAVTIVAAILFGFAPALQSGRFNMDTALREGGLKGGTGSRGNSFRQILLGAEAALALLLLTGAGLMVRSFLQIQSADMGFNPQGLLVLRINLNRTAYTTGEPIVNYYRQLLARLRDIPGVTSAGAATGLPMSDVGINFDRPYRAADRPAMSDAESHEADLRVATPGYLEAIGARLVRGQFFNDLDTGKVRRVVIVNEALARDAFPNQEPIGKRLMVSFDGWNPHEVIGVIRDTRYYGVKHDAKAEMFFPQAQYPYYGLMNVAIRVSGNTQPIAAAIRRAVAAQDPSTPVQSLVTMDELRANAISRDRLALLLLGMFGAMALIMAASGIFGVVSYTSTLRTREFGIRMALGATPAEVRGLVMRQAMTPVVLGLMLGLGGALGLTRVMADLLFHVRPFDPLTYTFVTAFLIAVAASACVLPARRATRIDPVRALRDE